MLQSSSIAIANDEDVGAVGESFHPENCIVSVKRTRTSARKEKAKREKKAAKAEQAAEAAKGA